MSLDGFDGWRWKCCWSSELTVSASDLLNEMFKTFERFRIWRLGESDGDFCGLNGFPQDF